MYSQKKKLHLMMLMELYQVGALQGLSLNVANTNNRDLALKVMNGNYCKIFPNKKFT